MIYLIYGFQLPVIKKTLKTTIKQCLNGVEQDDFNVIKLSGRNVLVQDIVYESMSLPLGGERKVVVVSEPFFLSSEKEKCSLDKDNDYDKLINYINNPSEYTDLIFFLEAKDINSKSALVKAIKEKGKIIPQEVLTENMLKNMGMSLFVKKGIAITNEALDELVSRCGDDISKFTNETNKLALYSNTIGIDDVKLMVSSRIEDNAFNIAESLIINKIDSALKIYYDLRLNKEEPVRLISLIATQFRFILMVSYLNNLNLSTDQIAKELKCNPYRVTKSLKSLALVNNDELKNVLEGLFDLDYKIKSGEKDPYYGFELFILNFNEIKKNNNLNK